MKEKSNYFASFLFALVGLFAFLLCYYISFHLLGFVIQFLTKVPILGNIVIMLFAPNGETTNIFLTIVSSIIAYGGTLMLLALINKHEPTFRMSCSITGMIVVVIQMVFIVINYSAGETVLSNISQLISGYLLYTSRK